MGAAPSRARAAGLSCTLGALIQGMSVQARDGAGYEELMHIASAARTLLSAAGNTPPSA